MIFRQGKYRDQKVSRQSKESNYKRVKTATRNISHLLDVKTNNDKEIECDSKPF